MKPPESRRITTLLKHFGISQKEFSQIIQISESALRKWGKESKNNKLNNLPIIEKLEKLMESTQGVLKKEHTAE